MNYNSVSMPAGLHLVATPIGSARDITLRALDTLASVDVLAAEDTRRLRHLMDIHGIPLAGRRLLAYHDHSGPAVLAKLLDEIRKGRSVAYASEAGMPLIADPGFELVQSLAAQDILVTCAPGPSAALNALVLSGLPTDTFLFAGFLPNAKSARRTRLEALARVPGSLIFYESPKRLKASLTDMAEVLGEARKAAVCRELTKKFEEIRRGTLQELAVDADGDPPKGEIVVIVDRARSEKISDEALDQSLRLALRGASVRDAAQLVAEAHDLPKRQVYQRALKLAEDET